VGQRLEPFLPGPRVALQDGQFVLEHCPKSIGRMSPFFGNFLVAVRAYAYILHLGDEGLREISENAILTANYVLARLKKAYNAPFPTHCMHECVLSAAAQVKHGVRALDIAKALLDKGFHAPTVYFPLTVKESIMIEPTETESKETLDAFCDAMLEIAAAAESDAEALHEAPRSTPVGRLDEVRAARQLDCAC
jgi:glycine dehydrogenase subunit 2